MAKDIVIDPSELQPANNAKQNTNKTTNDIVIDPVELEPVNPPKEKPEWSFQKMENFFKGAWEWVKKVGSTIGNASEDAWEEVWLWLNAAWTAVKNIPLVWDVVWNALQDFWNKLTNTFSLQARQQRELESKHKENQEKIKLAQEGREKEQYVNNIFNKYFPPIKNNKIHFALNSNAESVLKSYLFKKAQDNKDIQEDMTRAQWNSGVIKFYYNTYKWYINKIYERMWQLLKKKQDEKWSNWVVTSDDMEDIFNDEQIKDYARNADKYYWDLKTFLNFKEIWNTANKVVDKFKNLDILWWLKELWPLWLQWIETLSSTITHAWARWLEMWLDTAAKIWWTIWKKIEDTGLPVVSEAWWVLDKIPNYIDDAQYDLWTFASRIKWSEWTVLHDLDYIWKNVLWFVKYAPWIVVWLWWVWKAWQLFWKAAKVVWAWEKMVELAEAWWWMLLWTDLIVDWIVNYATNTYIDDKQVAADFFYNLLFWTAATWLINWYKLYKEWLEKEAEKQLLNTTVDVPFINKNNEKVTFKIKVWDYFKSPGEVLEIAQAKDIKDIDLFKKVSEGVINKTTKLISEWDEKKWIRLMRQFNLQVAKFFGDKKVLENVKRLNKTNTWTKEMYNKMLNVTNGFIKLQAENIAEWKKAVNDFSAYKYLRNSFANRQSVYDYLNWLDKVKIKVWKKEKTISLPLKEKADLYKAEYDALNWVKKEEFTNKVISNAIKYYNEQIFKDTDTVPLSMYLEWLKKVLWWAIKWSNKDLKNMLHTNAKTIDRFEKMIKVLSHKNKEYKIWKTTKWNALARSELASKLIKLNTVYKDFKNPEDFLVVLMHELTHLTEEWLKEVWWTKLVSKLKEDWTKLNSSFTVLNWWRTIDNIKPFNTKKEIYDYLNSLSKPWNDIIDDIVDVDIKLNKTINEKIITNAETKDFLAMFLNNKKQLLDNVRNSDNLETILKEFYSFQKQYKYARKVLGIDVDFENYLQQYKQDIANKIMQKYNINDFDIAVVKYYDLLGQVADKYDPLIRDLNLKRILYEMSSYQQTITGWVKWFSEFLGYILSEDLVKWKDSGTISKIARMLGANWHRLNNNIEEAAQKILWVKYKNLISKDIDEVEKIWSMLNKVQKYKAVKEQQKILIKNLHDLLKYPSSDNLLELVDNLNENAFWDLIKQGVWYNKSDVEEMIKVLWFEKTKRYIWNDILLWITWKQWIISWWLWEWILKDKDVVNLKHYIRVKLPEYLWDDYKKLDKSIRESIDPQKNLNISKYFDNLSYVISQWNNKIIWAVWRILDDVTSKVWKQASKTIWELLQLSFLQKDEKELLQKLGDLYDAYENEKLYKVFSSFSPHATKTLLKNIENVNNIEKNILTKNKKTEEQFIKDIKDLIGKLGKKWVKNLWYILRVWKSWKGVYEKINLTKVHNILNISAFHNVVDKLWYKNSDSVVPSFIEKVKEFATKKWLLPKDSVNTNFIFNLYWYKFEWTTLQLDELAKKINLWVKEWKDIWQILDEAYNSENKLWLIKSDDVESLTKNDILNRFFFNPSNMDKYEEVLQKWQVTPQDYIDVLYDIFKPDIANDLSNRLIGITTNALKEQWVNENTVKEFTDNLLKDSQQNYDTVSKIDNQIEIALGDVKAIDPMVWKFTDIPVGLQRYNASYSAIGWEETISIANKQWIVFQLQQDKNWTRVIKSKLNANSSYLDKESPLASTISKSQLDFEYQINNITDEANKWYVKKFINNCL